MSYHDLTERTNDIVEHACVLMLEDFPELPQVVILPILQNYVVALLRGLAIRSIQETVDIDFDQVIGVADEILPSAVDLGLLPEDVTRIRTSLLRVFPKIFCNPSDLLMDDQVVRFEWRDRIRVTAVLVIDRTC